MNPQFSNDTTPTEAALAARFSIFDAAAKKDIHWWFFALLMIGMGYVAFERWESRKESMQQRQEIAEVRKDQMIFLTTKNEAMIDAVSNNTKALERNSTVLERLERKQ